MKLVNLLNFGGNKKLLFDSFLGIGLRVFGALINLLFIVSITRALSIEEAGVFFFCFAVVSFFALVSSCGLDSMVLKKLGQFQSEKRFSDSRQVIYKYLLHITLFGFIVSFVIFSLFFWVDIQALNKYDDVLKVACWSIPFLVLLNMVSHSFQGLSKTFLSVISNRVLFPLFMIILLLLFGVNNALSLSFLLVVVSFCVLLLSVLFLRRYFQGLNLESSIVYRDIKIPLSEALEAKNLWSGVLYFNILFWSGQIIGGLFLDVRDISNLGAAQRVAISVSLILIGINMVVAPKYAALFSAQDIGGVRKLTKFSLRLIIIGTLPVLLVIFIFAEKVMLLFGEEYIVGANLLRILVFGEFVNIMCGSVGYILKMSGCANDYKRAAMISALIAVLLNFILVYFLGVTGSATAVVAGIVSFNVLSAYYIYKRHGYNPVRFW